MSPPRDPAELKAKVGDPGFTPSLRDVPALVGMLGEDEEEAKNAERALVRLGSAGIPKVVGLGASATGPVRAGLARLLGRLPGEEATLVWLLGALRDEEPRVRRAAAHALGKLGTQDQARIEAALLPAFERASREQSISELKAIVAALGKVGSAQALERIQKLSTDDPELGRVSRQASVVLSRGIARADEAVIDAGRAPPEPSVLVLRCREGLEGFVRDEVKETGGTALRLKAGADPAGDRGAVRAVLSGPMRAVFAVRTMTDFAFELDRARLGADAQAGTVDILVRAFTSQKTKALVSALTRGPMRYRIAWGDGGHKRADIWRCAQAIAERAPEWTNDPKASTWEVRAQKLGPVVSIELVPRAAVDPRFVYRHRDVPAASHPTLAAALVRAAGVRPDDVVWDPFVGSGTELVERAKAGPYRALHGSDTDPRALDAARENFEAASLQGVTLTVADATSHAPPGVTVVLTNPPMGLRVMRSKALVETLERFVAHVAAILPRGGRLVWLSPLPARSSRWAASGGLTLRSATKVDMGGFPAELQVLHKAP